MAPSPPSAIGPSVTAATEPKVPPAPASSPAATTTTSSAPPRPINADTATNGPTSKNGLPPSADEAKGTAPGSKAAAPAASTRPPAAVGSALPGLPAVKVLSSREQNPTDASPLTYREYSFAVPTGTSEDVAVSVLRGQLELVDAHLANAKMGKLVNLAVFDVEFTGKPPSPPIATLSWKDWKGEPVIGHPRRGAASEASEAADRRRRVEWPAVDGSSDELALPAPVDATVRDPAPWRPASHCVRSRDGRRRDRSRCPDRRRCPDRSRGTGGVPGASGGGCPRRAEPFPCLAVVDPAGHPVLVDGADDPAGGASSAGAATSASRVGTATGAGSRVGAAAGSRVDAAAGSRVDAAAGSRVGAAAGSRVDAAAGSRVVPPPAHASVPPPAHASVPPPAMISPSQPPPANNAAGVPIPVVAPVAVFQPVSPGSVPPPAGAGSIPPPAAVVVQPAGASPARRPSSPEGLAPRADGMVRTPSGRFVRGRTTGDELITALFESMHDLHFLRDALDGGQFCLALATEVLPARAALIHFFDVEKREWVIACTRGKDTSRLLTLRTAETDELLRDATRKRRAIVTPNASDASAQRYQTLGGSRSMIIAPIMQAGRALGAIEIINPLDGMPFTEDEGNAMTYIAEQYAEYLGSRGIVLDRDRIQNAATPR